MKRILFALSLITFATSICFAQQPPIATKNESKVVKGKVASITMADPVKGTKSEIAVTDDGGKTLTLLVKSTTTIYDAEAKAITLGKIAKDEKVKIKYTTTAEGVLEALSINVVK